MEKSYFNKVFLLSILLFFISQADVEAQCAMCKQAAESSLKSNSNSMARGLNSGILYLMAVPYLALAFIFRKQIFQLWKMATANFSKRK